MALHCPSARRPSGLRLIRAWAFWLVLAPTLTAAQSVGIPSAASNNCAGSLGAGARTLSLPQGRLNGEGAAAAPADLAVAWLPQPVSIPQGRHFAVLLRVCSEQAWMLERVDADMPAHRHGMNYRPSVQKSADQQWRVDGLMFHMSGRWRLMVDLSLNGERIRLTDEVDLR